MSWTFNPYDHYYQVTDTDPSTHRFSSALWLEGSTPYVVLADSDYQAFLTDGGVVSIVATDDELKLQMSRLLLNLGDKPAKIAVKCATTANITLSGAQTIDGISAASGDRVLVKDQSTVSQNGIYVCQAGSWVRAPDANTSQKLISCVVYVELGGINSGSYWRCGFSLGNVLGTSNCNWYPALSNPNPLTTTTTFDGVATNYIIWYDSFGGFWRKITADNMAADTVFANLYQPLDATLTAVAAYNTNGLLTQTAADTFTGRTITGTANEITVTNGDGVSGAPTLSLPTALTFTGKTVTGGTFSGIQKALTFSDGYIEVNDATYTVGDDINCIVCNRAGTITLTLPAAASWPGREIKMQTYTANTVVSAASDVVAAGGGAAGTAILAATAGKWATLVSNGTYWYVISYN